MREVESICRICFRKNLRLHLHLCSSRDLRASTYSTCYQLHQHSEAYMVMSVTNHMNTLTPELMLLFFFYNFSEILYVREMLDLVVLFYFFLKKKYFPAQ